MVYVLTDMKAHLSLGKMCLYSSVAVLTFNVIQGWWFSSHLKGHFRFRISDSNLPHCLATIHHSHTSRQTDRHMTTREIDALYSIAMAHRKLPK